MSGSNESALSPPRWRFPSQEWLSPLHGPTPRACHPSFDGGEPIRLPHCELGARGRHCSLEVRTPVPSVPTFRMTGSCASRWRRRSNHQLGAPRGRRRHWRTAQLNHGGCCLRTRYVACGKSAPAWDCRHPAPSFGEAYGNMNRPCGWAKLATVWAMQRTSDPSFDMVRARARGFGEQPAPLVQERRRSPIGHRIQRGWLERANKPHGRPGRSAPHMQPPRRGRCGFRIARRGWSGARSLGVPPAAAQERGKR